MKKLFVIARNEIILRYADPTVLIFSVFMPLTIAALIYLAFGNVVLGRGIPEAKVPVGIVNRDRGGEWGNFGQLFVRALIPDPASPAFLPASLLQLFSVQQFSDETQARSLVERDELVAVLLIPPDFTESLAVERAEVEVYISGRENILGMAFKSVVETLANSISSGEVAVRTTVQGLLSHPRTRTELQTGELDEAMAELVLVAVQPESHPIQIQVVPPPVAPAQLSLAHYMAASIAILFIGFTGLMASANIFHDKAQWTLQRTVITPTRSGIILGGKILGTYLISLIQLGMLVGGIAALEWALGSEPGYMFEAGSPSGIDPFGLAVLILALAAATTGLGVAIAGLAGTYLQAANYGRAFLVLMGIAGGVFFPVELLPPPLDLLSRLTYQYWAMAGYLKLALGGNLTNIILHCLILTGMGVVLFAAGSRLLIRRVGFL